MRFNILVILCLITLAACGGGGGGGGGTSSSVTAIDWTTNSTIVAPTATFYNSASSVGAAANNNCFVNESYCGSGGVYAQTNASTDSTTISYEGYGPDMSSVEIASSDIVSVTDVTSDHTLASKNYSYSHYDVANGVTHKVEIIIPTNYTNQTWLYWDNTHDNSATTYYYNVGVFGDKTKYTDLPSSGTATYTGGMQMLYGLNNASMVYAGQGDSTFTANWSTEKISGSFTNIVLTEADAFCSGTCQTYNFPNITMAEATIQAETGTNLSPGNPAYFHGDLSFNGYLSASYAYNELHGYFFGDNYEEIGGTFELTSTNGSDGAGYFAAKK